MKRLSYACPTSPLANKYNGGKGCWILTGHKLTGPTDPMVFRESSISTSYNDAIRGRAFEYLEKSNEPLASDSFTREIMASRGVKI